MSSEKGPLTMFKQCKQSDQGIHISFRHMCTRILIILAPDKALIFLPKKYWYFSNLSTKTYDMGTH